MTDRRQIVAMGGGGFSNDLENLALEEYVLSLTGKDRPKVCFVPTASGDSLTYIEKFNVAFERLPSVPTTLSLFQPATADLRSFVLEQDVVYVGGGNTKNLLVLWREWGLDSILKEAWEQGTVLAGLSAGSICWFEQGVTDSIPGSLTPLACLGFLPGSNCPHYDSEPERRPSFHRLILEGKIGPGYAVDDDAALHFVGTKLKSVVTSRPEAKAYEVRAFRVDGTMKIEERTVS